MNKIKIHEFDPIIYPFKIWIIINKTPDILSEHFKEYSQKDILWGNSETSKLKAFSLKAYKKDNSSYGAILYFRNKNSMSYGLVAHEASHAAKFLFEHIDAEIYPHEPFEYVLGWIADCCYKVKSNKF